MKLAAKYQNKGKNPPKSPCFMFVDGDVGIMMIIQWMWGYRRKRLSHETGNAG